MMAPRCRQGVSLLSHCWRCKYRSCSVTRCSGSSRGGLQGATLEEIAHVRWVPPWVRRPFHQYGRDRSDWCNSRQASGVCHPAFVCEERCGQLVSLRTGSAGFRKKSVSWECNICGETLPRNSWAISRLTFCECRSFGRKTDIMEYVRSGSAIEPFWRGPELPVARGSLSEGSDQHGAGFDVTPLLRGDERKGAVKRSDTVSSWTGGAKNVKSLGNVSFLRRSRRLPVRMCASLGRFTVFRNDVRILRRSTITGGSYRKSEIMRDFSLAISTGLIRRNTW
jgi:isoleucyl-tRNA synthetase